MSFTNVPVTRTLVFGLISSSVLVSLFDVKHNFFILVDDHIWRYGQYWRALTYQLCCTNSTEALFACLTLYNMRVVERVWGSRKYASFVVVVSILTAGLHPFIVSFLLRPISKHFNYVSAGPTPLLFAILAQYHAIIPHIYRYRIVTSHAAPSVEQAPALTFSDKSYRYVCALQLALFQWPGSLVGAVVGWVVGYSWRNHLLPGILNRWRLPTWMVGAGTQKRSTEFEGLRRRLEGQGSSGMSTGVQAQGAQEGGPRRPVGQEIMDQLRGAL